MTVSEHIYTASLVGSPDRLLSVRGGRITLDAGRAPHVTADLDVAIPGSWQWITTEFGALLPDDGLVPGDDILPSDGYPLPVWVPDDALLVDLDPRLTPRVRITATHGDTTREFNLCLRDRDVRHADGVISLTLASDEALLTDFAPLADDTAPIDRQDSLRAVVDYVLNQAIPGAALEPGGPADVPFRVLSNARQLYENASVEGTGAGTQSWAGNDVSAGRSTAWSSDGGASLRMFSPTSSSSYATLGGDLVTGEMRVGMQAGNTYTVSRDFRLTGALGGTVHARARRIAAFWVTPAGISEAVSSAAPNVAGVTRQSLTFTLPPDATAAAVRFYHGHSTGESWTDAVRLSESQGWYGEDISVYFDGNTPDTAEYGYVWDGTPLYSQSRRIALIDRAPDLLLWKAGQDALDFLHAIVQVAGYRLVCDETRSWTLRDENYSAPGALSVRHAVNLIDADDSIGRDAGLWFDAAVTIYTWLDQDGVTRTRADSFALTTPYTRLRKFEKNTPYPGPGFSEYAVRRAQGRGREVSATSVADWTANAEQLAVAVLDGSPTQVGNTQSVSFDLDTDRMTITLRTLEIPAGAIDLLTGTIDALTGTINDL